MENVDLKEIGNTLKKMREQLGVTQQELADKTGVTVAYIYQIEKMPKPIFPSREYLRQFIDVYMLNAAAAEDELLYKARHNTVNSLLKMLGEVNYQYYAKKYERKVAEKYSDLFVK